MDTRWTAEFQLRRATDAVVVPVRLTIPTAA